MTKLWGDLETYCDVPIAHGTHAYAERAEIMLFPWAIDDGPVHLWDLAQGEVIPPELNDALADPAVELWFHNSHFDRTVLRHTIPAACPPISRWRDTMVQAYTHSLPGSLDKLCDVLDVPAIHSKDAVGKKLIHLFCKPRPKNHKLRRATHKTHPEEWEQFRRYAALDVVAMRACHKRMPVHNYQGDELALWHLDQEINDRGFAVDCDLIDGAVAAVAKEQKRLARDVRTKTAGVVDSATQRDAFLTYIHTCYGVDLQNLQKATLTAALDDPDMPEPVKDLIRNRLNACTTSVAKYKTLRNGVSSDGRMRGTLQFCGASRTGRWAGRKFQPQNLPRQTLETSEINAGITALQGGFADLISNDVMGLTSNAVRGALIAPPGHKLVVSDLSNIEGRVVAWLSGEQGKLDAFRAFDEGRGPDLYKVAAAKAFNITPADVSKPQRQIGKVMELMLGYEGGVGAFLTGAATYNIDLDEMARLALPNIPPDLVENAKSFLEWQRSRGAVSDEMPDHAFVTCDAIKRAWRLSNPKIATYWKTLETAAVRAVEWPNMEYRAGPIRAVADRDWLLLRLPSGRFLCYPQPRSVGGKLTYMGQCPYSRKWKRLSTYGGKLVENATQAVSRDILASAMPVAERAGYRIVLTVHDELVTEAPDTSEFTPEHLSSILATNPQWAPGVPLSAAGFEDVRYRKD